METFAEKGNEGIYFSLQKISCISLSALEKELPEGSGAGAYSISLCYLCGWLWELQRLGQQSATCLL